MPPNPRQSNGHRRRQLVARVKAEETHCALCGTWVDPDIPSPLPMSGTVDEDLPVSRGGSPLTRTNTHLMHRHCNTWKSTRTLAEARAALTNQPAAPRPAATVKTSRDWSNFTST